MAVSLLKRRKLRQKPKQTPKQKRRPLQRQNPRFLQNQHPFQNSRNEAAADQSWRMERSCPVRGSTQLNHGPTLCEFEALGGRSHAAELAAARFSFNLSRGHHCCFCGTFRAYNHSRAKRSRSNTKSLWAESGRSVRSTSTGR